MTKIIETLLHIKVSQWLLVAMMAGGGVILMVTAWRLWATPSSINGAEASVILGIIGAGGLVFGIFERLNK